MKNSEINIDKIVENVDKVINKYKKYQDKPEIQQSKPGDITKSSSNSSFYSKIVNRDSLKFLILPIVVWLVIFLYKPSYIYEVDPETNTKKANKQKFVISVVVFSVIFSLIIIFGYKKFFLNK